MKRIWPGVLLLFIMIGIYGCNKIKTDTSFDRTSKENLKLDISISKEKKNMIPNPAKTKGKVEIRLHEELDRSWDEISTEEKNNYYADLSFAGFQKEVLVSSFVVGNMTNTKSDKSKMRYLDKKGREEEIKGNCLGLFVMDVKNTKAKEEDREGTNYFVVVDYAKKTYYKTKTEFFFHGMDQWTALKAMDVTGDGKTELVAQRCYNKSIELGVFRCKEKTHQLVDLFSTLDDIDKYEDYPDRALFSGYPIDDYKVVLEFKDINYSKTISLLDVGFKKKDLESDHDPNAEDDDMDWLDWQFISLWKNGKILKNKVKEDIVFLYTLDYVDFLSKKGKKPQIDLIRGIFLGHRSEWLGNMHQIYEYDSQKDRLVMKDARFSDVKKAEKEMKSWIITDDMFIDTENL